MWARWKRNEFAPLHHLNRQSLRITMCLLTYRNQWDPPGFSCYLRNSRASSSSFYSLWSPNAERSSSVLWFIFSEELSFFPPSSSWTSTPLESKARRTNAISSWSVEFFLWKNLLSHYTFGRTSWASSLRCPTSKFNMVRYWSCKGSANQPHLRQLKRNECLILGMSAGSWLLSPLFIKFSSPCLSTQRWRHCALCHRSLS